MRNSSFFRESLKDYFDNVIVVEGKKDVNSLREVGFNKVFPINFKGLSLNERIEDISKNIDSKEVVCILTDLDKTGDDLFRKLVGSFVNLGFKVDKSLRESMRKAKISHVEGLSKYVANHENFQ